MKSFSFLLMGIIVVGAFFLNAPQNNRQKNTQENREENKKIEIQNLIEIEKTKSEMLDSEKVETVNLEEKFHELRTLKNTDDIETFIENLERLVNSEQMILKLNNGIASIKERELFAKYLQVRNESYIMLMNMQLDEIQKEYL